MRPWLIHVAVGQKSSQDWKVIISPLKINKYLKNSNVEAEAARFATLKCYESEKYVLETNTL